MCKLSLYWHTVARAKRSNIPNNDDDDLRGEKRGKIMATLMSLLTGTVCGVATDIHHPPTTAAMTHTRPALTLTAQLERFSIFSK